MRTCQTPVTKMSSRVLPIIALLMVIVVLTPVDAWRQPYTDAVYHGFDPNLIYLGAEGNDAHEAVVGTSGESLRLTPFPGTTSTVHLLAADRDFRTDMDITVRGAPSDSKPLRIVVWRPALWEPFGNLDRNLTTNLHLLWCVKVRTLSEVQEDPRKF